MKQQKLLSNRIQYYCQKKDMSYYKLAYRSAVPLTTLLHVIDCSTKNPGIFTLIKICNGLGITMKEFFDSEEFKNTDWDIDRK